MARKRREITELSCSECHNAGGPMFLHQRCHNRQGLVVSANPDEQTLDISCMVCEQLVCQMPVRVDASQIEQDCHVEYGVEVSVDQGRLTVGCRMCNKEIAQLKLCVEVDG